MLKFSINQQQAAVHNIDTIHQVGQLFCMKYGHTLILKILNALSEALEKGFLLAKTIMQSLKVELVG